MGGWVGWSTYLSLENLRIHLQRELLGHGAGAEEAFQVHVAVRLFR